MKNELEERINLQEEISDQVIKRLEAVEKRAHPDYTKTTSDLNKAVTDLSAQTTVVKDMVSNLPHSIILKKVYAIDFRTKGYLIGLVSAAIVFITILSLYISSTIDNNKLRGTDLKFRAIRQVYPIQADWADKLYQSDPDHMLVITDSLEEASKIHAHTRDVAEQSARESQEAKKRLEKLKKEIDKP